METRKNSEETKENGGKIAEKSVDCKAETVNLCG